MEQTATSGEEKERNVDGKKGRESEGLRENKKMGGVGEEKGKT